jgi:hypothetical protein
MSYNSSEDMLGLIAELNCRRIPKVTGTMMKRAGGRINLSPNVQKSLIRVRTLHKQFEKGEYQHTDSDESMTKACMDWLVAAWAETQNQTLNAKYDWNPQKLRRKEPLPRGSYEEAIVALAQW